MNVSESLCPAGRFLTVLAKDLYSIVLYVLAEGPLSRQSAGSVVYVLLV